MGTGRLEAFSDGVIAIIITIMVLELRPPHGTTLADLRPLLPVFLSYLLSFVYLGIYWNNHHHLLHATRRVNGAVLWSNLLLLFVLSLMPLTTAWIGENHGAALPTALYGLVLILAAICYLILQHAIVRCEGPQSPLASAIGRDLKGNLSPLGYALAIPLAFVNVWLSWALYVVVALTWLVPDRRIERIVSAGEA